MAIIAAVFCVYTELAMLAMWRLLPGVRVICFFLWAWNAANPCSFEACVPSIKRSETSAEAWWGFSPVSTGAGLEPRPKPAVPGLVL
jgi:hypothetical protein